MTNKIYYSANSKLAKEITDRFFDGVYYVWCSPEFDGQNNPPSSNPKDIFLNLHKDVKRGDNHSSKMYQIKAGLYKAVSWKRINNLITEEQFIEANSIIWKSNIKHFKPLLYIIPHSNDIKISEVKAEDRAALFSNEYIINELTIDFFDIIKP